MLDFLKLLTLIAIPTCPWRIRKLPIIIKELQSWQNVQFAPYLIVMKTAFILFVYAVVAIAKLLRPGGAKSLIAENLAVRHQLIIANRSRKRSPNLTRWDRFLLGIWTIFIKTTRVDRIAIVVSPATLFKFHDAFKKRRISNAS